MGMQAVFLEGADQIGAPPPGYQICGRVSANLKAETSANGQSCVAINAAGVY